ncbi:hypothetical protein JTE90_018772 [Oedothorax gibbosus]|uniref:Uncharacterized protein n=1 Tax=Oedothorax gibbosus TaxID=931172 RepID=A0AAV6UV99_9ARAC|nr:hypothetical protein JTE90_018772 [Oedothorax gibbosus]
MNISVYHRKGSKAIFFSALLYLQYILSEEIFNLQTAPSFLNAGGKRRWSPIPDDPLTQVTVFKSPFQISPLIPADLVFALDRRLTKETWGLSHDKPVESRF